MQRVTARFLLVLSLVSAFAPAALALSAPAPHACCMRKPMHNHSSHQAQFQAVDCCNHNCCIRPLTVSRWAQRQPATNAALAREFAPLLADLPSAPRPAASTNDHSVRAPPASSIV